MSDQRREQPKKGFFEIMKNLFWILIFLQFAPSIFSNLRKTLEEAVAPKTAVGYLSISGVITDATFYTKHIQRFLKSPHIKALLVRIDSPGGFPGSAQAIFAELKKFKEKKPVVAFIENIGASGAYNIAVACNHIVASPSALVGSIGVWLQIPPNIEKLAEDWKISFRTIQSGAYKTSGSPFRAMTPEEKAHLQALSDDTYNQFVKDVAQSRNISIKDHKIWADGKAFTGNQALKLKLIDQVGSRQDAIKELKKQAVIEDEIRLIKPPQTSKFMQMFGAPEDPETNTSIATSIANFIASVITKVSSNLTLNNKPQTF